MQDILDEFAATFFYQLLFFIFGLLDLHLYPAFTSLEKVFVMPSYYAKHSAFFLFFWVFF
jgi:hypothetical protein